MQPQPEFSDLGEEPEVTLPEGYEEMKFSDMASLLEKGAL